MKLYHITLDTWRKLEFYPRVPVTVRDDENFTQERICLSDSIENCLNLVSWAEDSRIEDIFLDCKDFEHTKPIRVYEFEIDDKDPNLVNPEEVYKNGVIDAMEFNEYWYVNKRLNPVNIYDVVVDSNYHIEGVSIYAYKNEDGYTLEDKEELEMDDNFDEDDFYESFYCIERRANRDIKVSKCEVVEAVEIGSNYQKIILEFKEEYVDIDEISDVLEYMRTLYDTECIEVEFEVESLSGNKFEVRIDAKYFGIVKQDIKEEFLKKGLHLNM